MDWPTHENHDNWYPTNNSTFTVYEFQLFYRPKAGTDKRVKALNEAILRLSKENEQLKSESHGLKEDLNRQIDDRDESGNYQTPNYSPWYQQALMSVNV